MAVAATATRKRVGILDLWRGIMITGVVLYHALYDITMVYGKRMAWFTDTPVFRTAPWILAGSFILIAGISSHYSKNNWRRGLQTLGVALAITVVTMFIPGLAIKFGVLHLIGVCVLLYALVWRGLGKVHPGFGFVLFAGLFLLTFHIYYRGAVGIPGVWEVSPPQSLYESSWGFLFGMPPRDFTSADYYPLLPWGLLFFAGAFLGEYIKRGRAPGWVYASHKGILARVGKKTMPLYLIHQPVLLPLLYLLLVLAPKWLS